MTLQPAGLGPALVFQDRDLIWSHFAKLRLLRDLIKVSTAHQLIPYCFTRNPTIWLSELKKLCIGRTVPLSDTFRYLIPYMNNVNGLISNRAEIWNSQNLLSQLSTAISASILPQDRHQPSTGFL